MFSLEVCGDRARAQGRTADRAVTIVEPATIVTEPYKSLPAPRCCRLMRCGARRGVDRPQGFRRRARALVTVSVVESPAVPPTTAPLLPGAVANSCSGIQLGITAEFHRDLVYDVTAAIHTGPPIHYVVGGNVGSLRRRNVRSTPPRGVER